MAISQARIIESLEQACSNLNPDEFIFSFLDAYGFPKSTITRLRKGGDSRNVAEGDDIGLKKKLYFRAVSKGADLDAEVESLKASEVIARNDIRFVIVTDFESLVAFDFKAEERLETTMDELDKQYAFFLPLAGYEKAVMYSEHPADVKASEKMGQLFDLIRERNDLSKPEDIHALNVFLTRLLFCFYAEDTGIFEQGQMTSAIQSCTQEDGSDVDQFFTDLFTALNLEPDAPERKDMPAHFQAFPYVNGGLLRDDEPIPEFGRKARRILLDCGSLNWSAINPDIFGSMFQAVIDEEQRGNLGQHYTSVSNIMKVIQPLFLDKLYAELEKSRKSDRKLKELLIRLQNLRVFDPACGSGNFLIIAYKELRKLEMEVIDALNAISDQAEMYYSGIRLSQFYGIEIDDFAHEVATLSLWLAEHQMNMAFKAKFGYQYKQTGRSSNLNAMGMREMQARAYEARDAQYLLLKAPPASGKSRALMFLGLDKLHNQGLKKVIVAVPEMSIGASFKDTHLTSSGFFTDWAVQPSYNLCVPGGEAQKVKAFVRFMSDPDANVLVCTHATLRFAYQELKPADFNDALLAIDEFHHTSADGENRLGGLIDGVMAGSNAHIVAMTGSYFRGDAVPILLPEDEEKFTQVTYSYYEQLNGYQYLKSLGIGYHFYTGRYLDALHEVLDTSKKTIVHIPNVNSVESTKDKLSEVDYILDAIGDVIEKDMKTGIITVKDDTGRILKVADLVDDGPLRVEVQNYLRNNVSRADDMDIIIALGMAKEGFDWPWCEHVLTIGYRSSLTEIIQIIGRATRDCEGKSHAQFTNLIAQPDAEDDDVKVSVNNMLKAITVSLLMEQVLAPAVIFKPRSRILPGEEVKPGTVVIEDTTAPVSNKVIKALENMDNIKAAILQKPEVVAPAVTGDADPEVMEAVEIPKVVEKLYPDMDAQELQTVSEAVHASMAVQSTGGLFDESELPEGAEIIVPSGVEDEAPAYKSDTKAAPEPGQKSPNRKFVLIGNKFVNIEYLNVDLIRQINPFQGAYEILSKAVTPSVLKTIQDTVVGMRSQISEEEAVILWPRINEFRKDKGREPSVTASDPYERRLADALAYIKRKAQERKAARAQTA